MRTIELEINVRTLEILKRVSQHTVFVSCRARLSFETVSNAAEWCRLSSSKRFFKMWERRMGSSWAGSGSRREDTSCTEWWPPLTLQQAGLGMRHVCPTDGSSGIQYTMSLRDPRKSIGAWYARQSMLGGDQVCVEPKHQVLRFAACGTQCSAHEGFDDGTKPVLIGNPLQAVRSACRIGL